MRVTVRLFARLRDIAGAAELARDVAPGATIRTRLARARGRISRASGSTSDRFLRPSTPTTRGWIRCCRTATKSHFCRRFREDEVDAESTLRRRDLNVNREPALNWSMFDKLMAVEQRYDELLQLLGTSQVQSDPSEFRKHAKAAAEIETARRALPRVQDRRPRPDAGRRARRLERRRHAGARAAGGQVAGVPDATRCSPS